MTSKATKMDCMILPQEVLDRFERRWAARMSQKTFHSQIQEVRSQQAALEGLTPQQQPATVTITEQTIVRDQDRV
jgi:hypothetical protein